MRNLKIVTVGDGTVGKTCLLYSFSNNVFPADYVPTVFDNYTATVYYESQPVMLSLWDTAGQADFDHTRKSSYSGAHCILICFALDSPVSLKNVEAKWFPEVQERAPGVPIILVGTKQDLRSESGAAGGPVITREMGQSVATKIGASYVEVSAKTLHEIATPFNEAVKAAYQLENKARAEQKKCCVML